MRKCKAKKQRYTMNLHGDKKKKKGGGEETTVRYSSGVSDQKQFIAL